jgi:hypothetical protein
MSARVLISATGTVTLLMACVSLAPGADKVRITTNAPDVANCNAVGNINLPRNAQGQANSLDADTEFRNQTVGFGGNTAFVTSTVLGQAVAYRCP